MRAGLFAFETQNIGDDMQQLAVLSHLPSVSTFLDRDRLPSFTSDDEVASVFNSWFLMGDDLRRPSPRVRPIWHGFCAGRPEVVEGEWLEYLRDQPVIGCRDLYSAELLAGAGIDTTWAGCLTLFLGTSLNIAPPVRREGVLFVDVPPAAEPYLPVDLVRRAERLSTFPIADIVDHPFERLAATARLLDRLARAEVVVTRRLHVALPAASVGTPVVAIPDREISFAARRFSGFDTIVPTVYLHEAATGLARLDWNHLPPARVPAVLHTAYARLQHAVAEACGTGAGRPGNAQASALDQPFDAYSLSNVEGAVRPAQMRIRLGDRSYPLRVLQWSDTEVVAWMRGFPGLSKFDLRLDVRHHGHEEWITWGRLRDLIAPTDVAPSVRRPAEGAVASYAWQTSS